jgi:hypothetical protein
MPRLLLREGVSGRIINAIFPLFIFFTFFIHSSSRFSSSTRFAQVVYYFLKLYFLCDIYACKCAHCLTIKTTFMSFPILLYLIQLSLARSRCYSSPRAYLSAQKLDNNINGNNNKSSSLFA